MSTQNLHIAITGAAGQLGQALKEEASSFKKMHFTFLDKESLNITDIEAVQNVLSRLQPDIIINTAAYTAVNEAEEQRATAFAVNQIGAFNIAQYCSLQRCGLIHISTDYVFNGSSEVPYTEEDITDPQTIYGKSKRAGEQAIIEAGISRYAIVRTSWLYSKYASNFVKTMLRLSVNNKDVSVVKDQYGSPTYANDLAGACLQIATQLGPHNSGIYHYANGGETTWYAFAKAIFSRIPTKSLVKPISSNEYISKTKRPQRSTLNTSKIRTAFQLTIPEWEKSLNVMLNFHNNQPLIETKTKNL